MVLELQTDSEQKKKKIRFFGLIIFFIGIVATSVVIHELIHWFQYNSYEKEMCISTEEPHTFVRWYHNKSEDTVEYALKQRIDYNEIEAMLFTILFLAIGVIYLAKNTDMFFKR